MAPGAPPRQRSAPTSFGSTVMASSSWYYSHQGQKFGPFSGAQLKQLVAGGKIQATDLVFREGGERWQPASSIKGLFPDNGAASPVTAAIPPRAAGPRSNSPTSRSVLPWVLATSAL